MITGQGAVLWLFSFMFLTALAVMATVIWILIAQRKQGAG